MVSEKQTVSSTYLSTPSQFTLAQVLKYLQCQFIGQLDIKERNLIYFILEKKKRENSLLGFFNAQLDSSKSYHSVKKGCCILSAIPVP